jgi:hypothetical protein
LVVFLKVGEDELIEQSWSERRLEQDRLGVRFLKRWAQTNA